MGCGASAGASGRRYSADDQKLDTAVQASTEKKADTRNPEKQDTNVAKTDVAPQKESCSTPEPKKEETHRRVQSVCDSQTVFERALLFVSRIPLFRKIPQADLPLVVKVMSTNTFKSGEEVIRQGDVLDKLYIILSGEAEVVRREEDNALPDFLVSLSSGDYFGERELLHAEVARATVRASGEQDLLTYSIAHDEFWKLELHERLCMPKRHHLRGLRKSANEEPYRPRIFTSDKSEETHQWLVKILQSNDYLTSLTAMNDELAKQLAASATKCSASRGDILFTQGEVSVGHLCIVESGAFDLSAVGNMDEAFGELGGSWGAAFGVHRRNDAGGWDDRKQAGDSFGELELLYSLPSAATVKASENTIFWSISSADFKEAFGQQDKDRISKISKILASIRSFNKLYQEERTDIAQSADMAYYSCDDDVVSQGEVNQTCYVLVEGEAQLWIDGAKFGRRLSATSERAEVFGEENLLNPGPSSATLKITSESAKVLEIEKLKLELVLQMPLDSILTDAQGERTPALRNTKVCLHSTKRKFMHEQKTNPQRDDIEIKGNLGSGHFGFVDLAVDKKTGCQYALKRVKNEHKEDTWHRKQLRKEKDILCMTNNRFVVKLFDAFKESNSWCFLMELVEGGDLRSIIYRDDICGNAECARFYCMGVVFAIEHLHERHIVHRDLKPDNIMLDSVGWPKVGDFGLSKFCVGRTFTACGTPTYMAPETFQASGHGLAVDWWSLGVLVFEIMVGKTPFESAKGNFQEILRNITRGIHASFPWPSNFDNLFIKFLSCLLQAEEARRLPMRQNGLKQMKRMSWFKDANWESYQSREVQPPVVPPKMGSVRPCLERESGHLQLQIDEKSESSLDEDFEFNPKSPFRSC